jgi:hypothetical protein
MANVNWKTFESKYNKREQWAFENMAHWLFCDEMGCPIGLFRYKNQAGIETEPIEKGRKFYGFQAKYYAPSTINKSDIIDSIQKAKTKNTHLNIILLYVKEFSESSKKDKKKPQYQTDIEQAAQNVGIEIEWRVPSNVEYQLSQPQNKWVFDIFFGDNGLTPDFFNNQVDKQIANLGPRFNKKLNFELPIARIFDNLAHNELFHKRFIKFIDNWLTEKSYRKQKDNEYLAELEINLESLRVKLKKWILNFDYSLNTSISLAPFLEEIKQFDQLISNKRHELYAKQDRTLKNQNQFDNELSRLREFSNANYEFINEFDDLNLNLVNNPALIIQGEAGCGKSHLLGDIATQRKNDNLPTILLLGTNFKNTTIEKNILEQLGLTCPFSDLLVNLNNIGCQINARVLILIDAINEGVGADLWKNQIAGFINEIAKYPAIGIALTIRSTYFHDIIPDSFNSDPNITIITHEGFKGNEYEALKLFCEFYSLKLPNFPILNPEFSKPLFLHLICEAAKILQDKSFPKGFNGINTTYNSYKKSLNKRFEEKRPEYKLRDIVTKAIEKLSVALFDSEYEQLEIQDAVKLFDKEFSQFPHLLSDLIEESVLIKMHNEYDRKNPKDVIFFSYQRLKDYFMAEELLKPYSTKDELFQAFSNDDKFKKITDEYQWSYSGIKEAFAILLPERFGVEIFDFIDFFLEKNDKEEIKEHLDYDTYEWITRRLLDSLKWRNIDTINDAKIIKWLEQNGKYIRGDDWFYTLIELTAIANHPFNSDRLHKILMRHSMPKRDSFWQKHVRWYSGYDDNKIAFPLRRLIDWAWTNNISYNTDSETARLVAQTLTWVLSSTDIALRDQTTKALVNLLEQKPDVLILTLKAFEKVDDLYILERLYAVAYGCILRTEKDDSIKTIAQYIYDTIFKDKNPPTHILLRDYARNAIEYAIYKNVGVDVVVDLIRPPYNREMPQIPSEEEISKYELDYNSPDFKQNYGRQQNQIILSVTNEIYDFKKYEIKGKLHYFCPVSYKTEQNYKTYFKTLNSKQRKLLKFLDTLFKCKELITDRKNDYSYNRVNKESFDLNFLEKIESSIQNCDKDIKMVFSGDEQQYLQQSIIPFLKKKNKPNCREYFDTKPIERWIIQRVFNLGYNKDTHGEYDAMIDRFQGYGSEYKLRSIGEKYQWIAWHEILSILTDNYKMEVDWGGKYTFYKGAWQNYFRDIDPAYITKNEEVNENIVVKNNKDWWDDVEYTHWNYPDSEWVKTIEDLINPKQVIEKKNTNGEAWIHLQHFIEWREPKKIGAERYQGWQKQVWYMTQGCLVKKNDKQKIINYLKNQNFWGDWLPKNRDDHSCLINREKFWSPAYLDTYRNDKKVWNTIKNTKYKVIVATESANGGIESDKSGANCSYNIPCKCIFEGMKLQYAPIDGCLKNSNGEIIVINSNYKGVLMRKKDLIQFLDENNLDIIWTLLGEKFSYIDSRNEESYFKVPCGVFYLEDGKIEGELKMYDRD